jgi:hypothetical protein
MGRLKDELDIKKIELEYCVCLRPEIVSPAEAKKAWLDALDSEPPQEFNLDAPEEVDSPCPLEIEILYGDMDALHFASDRNKK